MKLSFVKRFLIYQLPFFGRFDAGCVFGCGLKLDAVFLENHRMQSGKPVFSSNLCPEQLEPKLWHKHDVFDEN